MEDFVVVVQPFGGVDLYAAVFDGHGGDKVSRLASERFHAILEACWEREPAVDAMKSAFSTFDAEVAREEAGAVAVVSVLHGATLTVANVGDSQALLVSQSGHEFLTRDHRLEDREEYKRVVAAGARIRGPYMSLPNGKGVMTTRAFGDASFKEIGQISEPSIASRAIGPGDHWLVLGSDGVWDPLAADDVAAIVDSETTAKGVADRVLEEALAVGSDNVSVVVVRLSSEPRLQGKGLARTFLAAMRHRRPRG